MKTQLQPIVIHKTSIQSVSDKSQILDMTGRQRMYRDGYKGENVIVAVVDTGVNEHAELSGKLYPAYNYCHYSNNAADENGHGCINEDAKIITSKYGITTIKEFFELCPNIFLPSSEHDQIKDVSNDDLKTVSLEDKYIVLNKITAAHKVKVNEKIYKIKYGHNEVKLTPWHEIYVQTSSRGKDRTIQKKRADTLEKGDHLIINFESMSPCGASDLELFGIKITEDIMWAIGFITTDGHMLKEIKSNRVEVSQAGENIQAIQKFNKICSEIEDSKVACDVDYRNGSQRTVLYSRAFKSLCEYFAIPCGAKSKKIVVSQNISKLSIELIHAYIAGIIDGDGCVSAESKCRIVSGSELFVRGLYDLCNAVGIRAGCYKHKGYFSSTYGASDTYVLSFGITKNKHPYIYNNLAIERKKENIVTGRRTIKTIVIDEIIKEDFDGYFYDLSVENANNYLANGVIVSNTHVAGTIAGTTCGVAPDCKILPVKVLDKNGAGDVMDLIHGLRSLLDWRSPDTGQMVDIVSMSLACEGTFYDDIIKALWVVIQELTEAGIIVICAAGNTGEETALFPASFPEVITVGAVDDNLKAAYFTTQSPEVDVCQIGIDVVSCGLHEGYVAMSGTSMATPGVSGIAALMISKYKSVLNSERMTVKTLYDTLKMTTVDVEAAGIDHETGAGFVTFGLPIELRLKVGSRKVCVNGIEIEMEKPPFIDYVINRIFVPTRFTHEILKDVVVWDQNTQEASIIRY